MSAQKAEDVIDSHNISLSKQSKWISSCITAISNFSVQYNFSCISIALIMMSVAECTSSTEDCKEGKQDPWVQSTVTATVFAGAICGQLSMGYAGDIIGRDRAMMFTLALASIGALCSAIVSFGDPTVVYSLIIISRFVLGIGLGGVYPLSATKASEDHASSHGKSNPKAAALAFFWQVPGSMAPWLVAYIMSFSNASVSVKWRILLGLGVIPGVVVTIASCWNNQPTSKSIATTVNLAANLRSKSIQRRLYITGGGWFLYDVVYYGTALFGGEILNSISSRDDDNVTSNQSIRYISLNQLIAILVSCVGCILTIYLMDYVSLRKLHVYGFVVIAFFFALMAGSFNYLSHHNSLILYIIYCLLLASLSAGPNVTTFVLPAVMFPVHIRSTFNGISAAMGKCGAVLGAYLYGVIGDISSYVVVMIICSGLALVAAISAELLWVDNDEEVVLLYEGLINEEISSHYDSDKNRLLSGV